VRPHYRIGDRTLPLVGGAALIVAGVLLVIGLGSGPPGAAPASPMLGSPAAPPSSASTVSPSATGDPQAPIRDGYRIQIPRLGIDLPIAEGDVARDIDQQKTPESFAFHLPGTSLPGLGSNTYLYAHARAGMFLSLWNAKAGDEIFISTPELRVLKYIVSEVYPRIAPGDVSWVQPTAAERLTLQTSTGPSPNDPRFVVVAVPAT
jgi:LPXTG-site transpeptidase (sortase) family protein